MLNEKRKQAHNHTAGSQISGVSYVHTASSCSHYNLRDDPDSARHLAKKEEQLCRKIERIPDNAASVKRASI